jgi:hypothetical protein
MADKKKAPASIKRVPNKNPIGVNPIGGAIVKVVTDALLAPGSSIIRGQEDAAASRAKKASAPTLKQAERGVPYVGGLDHANTPKLSKGPATSAVLTVPRPGGEPHIEGPKSQTAFQRVQTNLTPAREANSPAPASARMSGAPATANPSAAPLTIVARAPVAQPAPQQIQARPETFAGVAKDVAKPQLSSGIGGTMATPATQSNAFFDRAHRAVDKKLFGGKGGSTATYSYPTGDNRSDKD